MLRGGLSTALGVMLASRLAVTASAEPFSSADRVQLAVYARDTWKSLDALASVGALPADNLSRTGSGWEPAPYTSPTNIAAYLWSTLAAENLRLITREESGDRLGRTLRAVDALERCHGFFYTWYDPRTGEKLRAWPGGGAVRPFLSSVDNGWLAAALMMVANARPELRAPAQAILGPMNFGFFYDPYDAADPAGHPGLLRGGYYPDEEAYTKYHYGLLNTEPRIASYIGISRGDLPPDHYFRMKRAGDAAAPRRSYCGVTVSEGSRAYRDMKVVPSWDGTMFEALMVTLFVPEATWAEASWGRNHAMYARAQLEYGLNDARLGYWGISASSDPDGGYEAYGAPPLAASPRPEGSRGIVTPHASFLALPLLPRQAMDNLGALAAGFPVYGEFGFHDSVDVRDGRVSNHILTLDQGMVMASIANALGGNILQQAFCAGAIETVIRPLIAPEQFGLDANPEARPEPDLANAEPIDSPRSTVPMALFAAPAALPALASPSQRRQHRGKTPSEGRSPRPALPRASVRRAKSRTFRPRSPGQGRAA